MQKVQKERTPADKLKECKELYIQNLQKNSVQKNMVYMFLKQNKIDGEVRNITINPKQGLVKLEFVDHDKAKSFYDDFNFKGKILLRQFNIYFALQLTQAEMKKYYLEGITDQNQRKLFETARKIGVCKLYTGYTQANRGKVKPNGVLSFIRRDDLTQTQFKQLQLGLKELNIKINKYVPEKDLKCSIKVTNFYEGNAKQQDENIIKEAQAQLRDRFGKCIKHPFTAVTINVRRKQVHGTEDLLVTGILQFETTEKITENYQQIRKNILKEKKIRAFLYFHNDQSNSYLSLFTSGLSMPHDLSQKMRNPEQRLYCEKNFEDKLLKDFRQVNTHVIQVNVYPVKRNNTYIGRVYLTTEQQGKNFIVDYTARRDKIASNYIDKNMIAFNINVDSRTLQKIKVAQKKATQMMRGIKMADQSSKRLRRQGPGPIGKFPGMGGIPGNFVSMGMPNMMGGIPNMGGPGPIVPPSINQPMNMNNLGGNIGGSISGNMGGMNNIPSPNMMGGMNMGGMGGMGGMGVMGQKTNPDYKAIAQKLIRDRDQLVKQNSQQSKRMIYPCLKYFIENECKIPSQQSGIKTQKLINSISVGEALDLIANPSLIKAKI